MMMIQIEYPAPARPRARIPHSDRVRRDGRTGPPHTTKQKEAMERSSTAPPSSDRRATTAVRVHGPSASLPPSSSASANQRSAASAVRRHSAAATVAPKSTDDGALSLGAAAAAKQKPKMVSIPLVRQSALVSSAEGKCLLAYLSSPVRIQPGHRPTLLKKA